MSAHGKTLLVDGYNVIRRDPAWNALFERDLEQARQALLVYCAEWKRRNANVSDVIVVFDGDATGTNEGFRPGIRAVYTSRGEDADSRILKILGRRHGRDCVVVSDDGEVARGARVEHAVPMSVWEFRRQPAKHRRAPVGEDDSDLTPRDRMDINAWLMQAMGIESGGAAKRRRRGKQKE